MTVPNNNLVSVQTYQESALAYMQNLNCMVATANTRFKNFEKMEANLGSSVSFDLMPRFTTTNSLVANFQPADQRLQVLTVDQQISTSYAFTAQEFIFQAEEYMQKFGKAAIKELSTKIEANVARNCLTNTYRFYGDGVTPITTFNQLAGALALFRDYGAIDTEVRGYLSNIAVPQIAGSGQNQFVMNRNEKLANSWEIGAFANCEWYQSNLLPVHVAGTVGQQALTLTVVSTTLASDGSVTAITFSISGSPGVDANAIKQYEKLEFNDGVGNFPNLRYLTFVGHEVSANHVQFQATADAASDGSSHVTVSINPALQVNPTNTQNINAPIVAGMQVSVLPSHRSGMITAGGSLFLAMPALPDEAPFPTGNSVDPETGVSVRQYYGSQFGQNSRGMVHDCIWGSTLVQENSMAIIFPV